MTSMIDVSLILESEIRKDLELLGGSYIRTCFANLEKPTDRGIPLWKFFGCKTFERKELGFKPVLRKLSHFGDSEGKTRSIGILDYWSQTVLKPLHDALMDILFKIPEDCTKDQTQFIVGLRSKEHFHSFDLTNATDRLPIEIQKDVIARVIGKEMADA